MIGIHFFSPYRDKKTFNNLEGNNMAGAKGFYSKEFKLNAVKLYINRDRKNRQSLKSTAEELKISNTTLSNWVLLYRDKGEEGLADFTPLSNVHESLKLKTLKGELDAMRQAYNGIKNELSVVIKERDSLLNFKKERDKLKNLAEAILKTFES